MKTTYETDFYEWSVSQADLLRKGEYKKVDWDNIIEEIESLGGSELSRLESHLENLLMHLLKKKFQSDMCTRSWLLSIKESQYRSRRTLEKNPSLKHKLDEIFKDAYIVARLRASKETGLPENTFPEICPWTIEEVLN